MKQSLIVLPGLASLAAAACCRTNQCLRAIVADTFHDGIADCASILAVTITAETVTVTDTVTSSPTEYTTVVESAFFTETETTTAATGTLVVTLSTTVTAKTETNSFTDLQTTASTKLVQVTETATVSSSTTTFIANKNRRAPTISDSPADPVSSAAASVEASAPAFPDYASSVCPSWEKYVSACSCAGVVPTTVTAAAASSTVTVTDTSILTSVVASTVASTETAIISETATASSTSTEVETATATVATTTTIVTSFTATASETVTVTTTVSPAGTCIPPAQVAPFKARATDYGTTPQLLYANMLNALTGGVTWQTATTSTSASVTNKYIWALDTDSNLYLAYNIPPYSYVYYAYVSTATTGSLWPQVNTKTSIESSIKNGGKVEYVKGCVNSATGVISLSAAGRTNMLWCGQQMWMSTGLGEDVNRGGACTLMKPSFVKA
ncbi:hypothetical protein B0T17DRAFT_621233 [Bombardia bombarda]|uniref:Uncharacterized protein n=1 Tax=Bombardia bombarda TaxID=252184 RepID=A0AA39W3X4_9PEZI|nr:hypothetical protein B0T17DRAFT_621233 [Bombardia bombarda]